MTTEELKNDIRKQYWSYDSTTGHDNSYDIFKYVQRLLIEARIDENERRSIGNSYGKTVRIFDYRATERIALLTEELSRINEKDK